MNVRRAEDALLLIQDGVTLVIPRSHDEVPFYFRADGAIGRRDRELVIWRVAAHVVDIEHATAAVEALDEKARELAPEIAKFRRGTENTHPKETR